MNYVVYVSTQLTYQNTYYAETLPETPLILTHIPLSYKSHHPLPPHDPISNTIRSIPIVHYCLVPYRLCHA